MVHTSVPVLIALALVAPSALATYPAPADEQALVNQKMADFDAQPVKPAHPRFLMGSLGQGIVEAAKEERSDAVAEILGKLNRRTNPLTDAELNEFISRDMVQDPFWFQTILPVIEDTAEAAFVYYVRSRDRSLLEHVTTRLRRIGPAVEAKCTASAGLGDGDLYFTREYMIHFALAYDFAHDKLIDADRQQIARILTACANAQLPTLPDKVRNKTTGGLPFNSLAKYAAALMLVRGDPEFRTLDRKNYTANAVWSYVWKLPNFGGEDGYSNGSRYFLWDTAESITSWDVLARVLRYPLYDKPYVKSLPHFLLWTLPPTSPAGAFGDGAEINPLGDVERLGTSIMHRYTTSDSASAVSEWFLSNTGTGHRGRLSYLLSPRFKAKLVPEAVPEPAGRSRLFASVGIAAFHSRFTGDDRTSIFFKSSPTGSINHAHMDQNSFVIYHKGQVLAMDSGHYDQYGKAHWLNWYKKTVAHNAITYNGTGQEATGGAWGSATSAGRIIRFNPAPTASDGTSLTPRGVQYDVVTGDAQSAYGQNLGKAERTLIYLREASTVIVIDQLKTGKTGTPRTWEYNFHTPVIDAPVGIATPNSSEVRFDFMSGNSTSMCLKVHAPESLVKTRVHGYGATPPAMTTVPDHFWNRFAYGTAAPAGAFVSIIRLDCKAALTNMVKFGSSGITVQIGNFEATITDDGAFTAR